MATRTILTGENPRLRKISREVKEITPKLLELLNDMAQTMYEAEGGGLAAPQVGALWRIVVIDVGEGLLELINPEIIEEEGSRCVQEACLSFPEDSGYVMRPKRVVVRAMDRHGEVREYEAEGILAQAFAHEIDHLDGMLFVDKVVQAPNKREGDTQ